MDNLLWVDKYKPKTIDDIFLKKESLNTITRWIKNFKNKKNDAKNCLLLYGPPGVGKTTIARLIYNEYNYDIKELNASDVRNQGLIQSQINKMLNKTNVFDLMNNNKKFIGIIMDEIDGMTSGDKGGLSELVKIMFPYKSSKKKDKKKLYDAKTPFICISNFVNEKKYNDLKKNSVFVKIDYPSKYNTRKLLDKICSNENIQITDEIKDLIIQNSQNDFRRLINLTEYLFRHDKLDNKILKINDTKIDDTKIDDNEIDDIINNENNQELLLKKIETFDKKDIDYTVYSCVEKLLNSYKNIDTCLQYYDTDKNLIGMLMYENFLNYIIKNKKDSDEVKMNNIAKIYENFCNGDNLDYYIYIHQFWSMYDFNGIYKCANTSHIINTMKKYSFNKDSSINFSSLLNKTSLEYLNYKNVEYTDDIFNQNSCDECFIDISNILFSYLFSENNIQKGINIMKNYNIHIDDLDKIVKVSSNEFDYKKKLTTKFKKKIALLL